MQFTRKKKIASAVAVGAMALASGGVAIAYWSSTGSGTGTNFTTDSAKGTLSFTNTTFTDMAPGVAPETFTVHVKNNNATGGQSKYVAGVTAYLTVVKGPASGTCDATDYTLDGHTNADSTHPVTLDWTGFDIPANTSHDSNGTDTLGFNDKATLQDACQGATVTVNYASN